MTVYFFDTSALAKRYVNETGSVWVKRTVRPSSAHLIVVSELIRVEMPSILARGQRENRLAVPEVNRLRNIFFWHMRHHYRVFQLDSDVLMRAGRLTLKHPLRTLDAIQLASALEVSRVLRVKPIFVGSDNRLLAIAQAEGFATDNPYLHP